MIPGAEFVQSYLSLIWPEWRVTQQLEKENGRSVFEICRSYSGTTQVQALKALYFENVPNRFSEHVINYLDY